MGAPVTTPDKLIELALRIEQASQGSRELADEVLFACGWQINADAQEIAAWRIDPGTVEGEDGDDYPVTFEDRMSWACWYQPGKRPYHDSWIHGHLRPNPLASLDAAMQLASDPRLKQFGGALGMLREALDRLYAAGLKDDALARFWTAACLRALSHQGDA